ncbi:Hypothetical predicted protein [Podarcis lilfordi]|uniref:Uncharacterized protein n=1 Tax=Podarcis lilfordi TaxID=74358 RepID=A0AA35L4H8_9SAUR|nr:Hypothetical predicted protein [Podarcis lilfordi]
MNCLPLLLLLLSSRSSFDALLLLLLARAASSTAFPQPRRAKRARWTFFFLFLLNTPSISFLPPTLQDLTCRDSQCGSALDQLDPDEEVNLDVAIKLAMGLLRPSECCGHNTRDKNHNQQWTISLGHPHSSAFLQPCSKHRPK